MRRCFALALLCEGMFLSERASARPSADPKYRTQVSLPDGRTAILTRDPFDPYAWYYIPPAIRLAETAEKMPRFRWVEFTLGAKQHAILQFAVVASVDKASEDAMREGAVRWFELRQKQDKSVVVPKPDQIHLSPVGPIRAADMRVLVLRNNLIEVVTDHANPGDPLVPVEPVDPKPSPDPKAPAEPKTGTDPKTAADSKEVDNRKTPVATSLTGSRTNSLPAVTELTQETWVQMEISGPGVQIIRELLKGKGQGGIILVYSGQYAAYAPEVNINVELNVESFASYFRERKFHSSGWSFLGLVGKKNVRIEDYINARSELKEALKIERIGGGVLSRDDWDKIEARLYAWVTQRVFQPAVAEPGTKTITDPGRDKLFNAGTILRIPGSFGPGGLHAELPLGYTSANSNLTVRAVGETNYKAKATWRGFDAIDERLVVYGAIGLQKYGLELQKELMPPPIKLEPLPTAYVSFPVPATEQLRAFYSGSQVSLNAGAQVRTIKGTRDGKWSILNDTLKNSYPVDDGVLVYFNQGSKLAGSRAEWSMPDPNFLTPATPPGKELQGFPRYTVAKEIDADGGTIAFGSDSFPFRPVRVDTEPLVGMLPKVKVRATLTIDTKGRGGAGWRKPLAVSFPILDQGAKAYDKYVTGAVTVLDVQFDGSYTDALLGEIPLAAKKADEGWVENQVDRLNRAGVGYVPVEPAALGLRRMGLSFNLLLNEGATSCDVTVTSKSEGGKKRTWSVIMKDGVARDAATNHILPDGVLWLVTSQRPEAVTGKVRDAKGGPRELALDPEDVKSWAARGSDAIPLK